MLSSIIMEFAPPPMDDKVSVNGEPRMEDESTDHGSILSDNDVSVDHETNVSVESECGMHMFEARQAPHPVLGLPNAAARRSELRKAGLEVLGNLSLSTTPDTIASGAKGKSHATRQGARAQQPPLPPPPQRHHQSARAEYPQQMAASMPQVSGPVRQMPLVPGPQARQWSKAPAVPQPEESQVPWKVEHLASFGALGAAPLILPDGQREFPVKKQPLFKTAPGADRLAFDPYTPLKKRVPEALLQDPKPVLCPVLKW